MAEKLKNMQQDLRFDAKAELEGLNARRASRP